MFDYTFCTNRTCPKWGSDPCCGRSTHNFEGKRLILWMSSFKPDENGECRDYMEPQEWKVEPWMEELALEQERRWKKEQAEKKPDTTEPESDTVMAIHGPE